MADTPVIANPGAGGASFAADQDGALTVWPYSKQAWGGSGVQNEVTDTTGKRLPVKVGEGLLAGSVVANQISLTGAEAALSTVAGRRFRLKALITNTDLIYLGPAGVTVGTGYPLYPGDGPLEFDVSNLNVIHAIVGSGTQVLAYVGEV